VGSLSLKFVKFADSPNGTMTPNPKVNFFETSFVRYRLATGMKCGLTDPL